MHSVHRAESLLPSWYKFNFEQRNEWWIMGLWVWSWNKQQSSQYKSPGSLRPKQLNKFAAMPGHADLLFWSESCYSQGIFSIKVNFEWRILQGRSTTPPKSNSSHTSSDVASHLSYIMTMHQLTHLWFCHSPPSMLKFCHSPPSVIKWRCGLRDEDLRAEKR